MINLHTNKFRCNNEFRTGFTITVPGTDETAPFEVMVPSAISVLWTWTAAVCE
jgi:hypothetical protein